MTTYYHGTKADLKAGDLIAPGYNSNYGKRNQANFVYLSATLDAAIWGAELALGEGRGRIYIVEPTGPIEDDPNLTNKRFPGNPTQSYRSRSGFRVMGEMAEWEGHPPAVLHQMREHLGAADVAFTNLEVAIRGPLAKDAKTMGAGVDAEPAVLDSLRALSFDLMSLSNNHAGDLGEAGILSTIEESTRRGFAVAGTGKTLDEAARPRSPPNQDPGVFGSRRSACPRNDDTGSLDLKRQRSKTSRRRRPHRSATLAASTDFHHARARNRQLRFVVAPTRFDHGPLVERSGRCLFGTKPGRYRLGV